MLLFAGCGATSRCLLRNRPIKKKCNFLHTASGVACCCTSFYVRVSIYLILWCYLFLFLFGCCFGLNHYLSAVFRLHYIHYLFSPYCFSVSVFFLYEFFHDKNKCLWTSNAKFGSAANMLLLFSFRTSSLDSLTGTMLSFICIYWWEQRGYSLPAN